MILDDLGWFWDGLEWFWGGFSSRRALFEISAALTQRAVPIDGVESFCEALITELLITGSNGILDHFCSISGAELMILMVGTRQ